MKTNARENFIDSLTIGISDSFVDNSNKIGSGNGEAKLYLGQQDSQDFKDFFGTRGFKLDCRLFKSDLIRFMNEIKPYYFNPFYEYRQKTNLKILWHERMKDINLISEEKINFKIYDQTQIDPPRVYAKSEDKGFELLRTLPLANIAKLVIVKYANQNQHIYDFKLVLDLPNTITQNSQSEAENILRSIQIDPNVDVGSEIERLRKERVGQEKFRAEVLKDCGHVCPFTGINDASLLIAGHIKPWSVSNPQEKVDPKNGFSFTPTFDKLFNDGLITFTESGELEISPLLSIKTRKSLHLEEGKAIDLPLKNEKHERRRIYLRYHRNFVFRK